jgi:predicted TIM-barrel fold metal-dependent hydrolase
MRRRDFLTGGVAFAAGSGPMSEWTLAQNKPAAAIDRIIDVHCHIFNADDLPVQGFIRKVVVPRFARTNQLVATFQGYPGALEALVRALAVQMRTGAPKSTAELAMLDAIDAGSRKKPTSEWRKGEDIKNLQGAFKRIWEDADTFRNLWPKDLMALEVAVENIQLFLVQRIYPLFGRPVLSPDERRDLERWDYKDLATKLYPRDDLVGQYIRWALLFTRFRFELGDELDLVHQLGGKSRVVLMTPASVDFSKWLEDESHTSLEDQNNLMSRLARRKGNLRIHGFAGFDPLRQALYSRGKHRPNEKEPMTLLQKAIEGEPATPTGAVVPGGLIGVKLYPPRGFRAIDNAELPDAKFNDPSYLASETRGLGTQIGAKLDRELNRLYAWCSAKNVPITAHTNNTFGPSPEYEARAQPECWGRVLRAYPTLRINMAHFGHFNRAVNERDVTAHVKDCWEWTTSEIMAAFPDGYAYADISSIAEILRPGPSRNILECMKVIKENFKNSADRFIYGTDWSMIAQAEGFPRGLSTLPYTDQMVKFLQFVGYSAGEIEGILFRNAARFLGLSKSERDKFGENCSRGRLEKFYAAYARPTDWMKALD